MDPSQKETTPQIPPKPQVDAMGLPRIVETTPPVETKQVVSLTEEERAHILPGKPLPDSAAKKIGQALIASVENADDLPDLLRLTNEADRALRANGSTEMGDLSAAIKPAVEQAVNERIATMPTQTPAVETPPTPAISTLPTQEAPAAPVQANPTPTVEVIPPTPIRQDVSNPSDPSQGSGLPPVAA